MNEIHDFKKDRVEITQEKKDRQEEKFIGKVYLKPGCSLWAFNPEDDSMTMVKINGNVNINMQGEAQTECRAMYNPRFLYFQAINEKSARRKLGQYQQGKYEVVEDFSPREFLKINFFD